MSAINKAEETAAVDLGALLDAGDGAVVTLEAGETRLAAHRAVLAARSPVFEAMFRHDTLESSSGVVSIADIEGPVLRQLLSYVYTLQAPQLPGVAAQLLPAADKYGLSALKDVCEQQVVAQLAVETAAASAVLGVRHSCPKLTAAAVSFIKDHVFQVLATQGWADAMRNQLEDVTEVNRLLADLSAKTAGAAPGCSHGQTAASTAAPHTPPPGDAAVSHVGTPDTGGDRSTASTNHSHCQTAAATPPPRHTPPPDDAAVARFRNLSAKGKGDHLLVAAAFGQVGDLRALLAAGADLRARDAIRRTALHLAADFGKAEVVRLLLEAGAEVDARDSSRATPLHLAARLGCTGVVRLLLASSADVHARESSQWTPLHWAARLGHAEVVAALLEAGADTGARDNRGRTPLDIARLSRHQEVTDLLT